MNVLNRLRQVLEANKEEYIARLSELIAKDTHLIGHGIEGGLEKNGQEYLARIFRSMGAKVQIEPLNEETIQLGMKRYQEGNPGHRYDERYNLIATFEGSGEGKSILFDSHIDTLPVEDIGKWVSPPLVPEIRDGKLYGQGASDMKSGLMASVMSVKLLQDAGIDLPGTVKILSVVDEHGGGNGTLAAVMNGHTADAAVICEPSDEQINIAHMGFIFFKIEVDGLGLHSGLKWKGINAIEKAMLLIQELHDLEHRWLMLYKHPLLPPPTINIGEISGGIAGSIVPNHCEFKLCIHYLPGLMSHESVIAEVTDAIMRRSQGDTWLSGHPPKLSVYQSGQGFEMETDHPLIVTADHVMRNVLQRPVAITGSSAGCDARLLKNIANIPTVMMGPGHNEECNKPNEHVDLENYTNFILIYALTILRWCRQGDEKL